LRISQSRARPRSSRRAVARQICSTEAGNGQHHQGKTLAIRLIGSAQPRWLLTSMSFPSHLHFKSKSKRIVNLNGGIPTDLAVPTTRSAPAFIDSRFDLVHRQNACTRILNGNLMPATIDTTELQNVPASFCSGHHFNSTLALWNFALVSHAHGSEEFFLICRDGG